jgi:hypothetical protein
MMDGQGWAKKPIIFSEILYSESGYFKDLTRKSKAIIFTGSLL